MWPIGRDWVGCRDLWYVMSRKRQVTPRIADGFHRWPDFSPRAGIGECDLRLTVGPWSSAGLSLT